MKNIGIYIILLLLLAACEKDLDTFSGAHCVDFVMESDRDSIVYSFAFYPGVEQGIIKIPVEIMGPVSRSERTYKYMIDPRSTARVGVDYEALPLEGKIAPGRTTDTICIRVTKNEDMADRSFTLFLNLLTSGDFEVGMPERALSKIYISDMLTQPQWWDDWYSDNVLGVYSDKKYRYFIEQTGISDLEDMELYKMRTTVLKFKYHIEEIRLKANQETDPVKKAEMLEEITDEDGNIMNIPLKGTLPDRDDEDEY